ncbi:MAG: HAMP domain-containing protein, partial [Desulfuromonadales bacterium]|nr:HAMP domain-containing protein [Desulfuromonadales bacterium]
QHDSKFVLQTLQSDFSVANKSLWTESTIEKHLFGSKHISLFNPIFYQNERIGTLYLLSDMGRLHGHLSNVYFAIIVSFLLMISLAWLLAGWLQKPISVPLSKLSALMENISTTKDYSVRAEKVSSDEVGVLVDGFNRMLEQIELHQVSLAEHQLHLEQTVADRTAELRAAVAGLKLAREQAVDATLAKSQFLSRMTHELRTPLIGVLGMNELLMRTSLSNQQQELVDTVQKSGKQLLQLIGDVLDFSRIEAGKLELEFSEFELCELIHEVVALLTVQAQQKKLSLQLDLATEDRFWVRADALRIRQILVNLIGNAIKFTATGSVVVNFNCHQQDDSKGTFVFEVEDTGVGISATDKQEIFESFYQADSASAATAGAGLGLAIVKQLVDLMDGQLELYSNPGQGSRFKVVISLLLVGKTWQVEGGNQ